VERHRDVSRTRIRMSEPSGYPRQQTRRCPTTRSGHCTEFISPQLPAESHGASSSQGSF
jgi:hypothetical protein